MAVNLSSVSCIDRTTIIYVEHFRRFLPFQTGEEALDSLKKGFAKDEELDLIVAEVHPGNTEVGTLRLFHHILNELEVPLITMCAYDEAASARMTLGTCFNVVKPLDTETVNFLKMRALQHRSIKNHRSETEDEEQDALNVNVYSDNLGRFIWSSELHEKFLQAVEVIGVSATARKIHQNMNAKDLNLTIQHIASHLQKHRLRAPKLSHNEEVYQHYASMKELSEMIASAYKVASAKPNNHPATTQTQFTHGVASAIWDKYPGMVWPHVEGSSASSAMCYNYPGKPWGQVGESSAGARVSQTNARPPPVLIHGTKSIWDRYEESLSYKREVLPIRSKALDGYGRNISVSLEREISRTESAGKIVINLESDEMQKDTTDDVHAAVTLQEDTMDEVHAAVTLQKDTMNEVYAAVTLQKDTMDEAHAAVTPHEVNEVPAANMGAGYLVDLAGNYHPAVENAQSKPFSDLDWEEMEKFWANQMEGQQEQQGLDLVDLLQVDGISPEELLQEDEAWNQALQPANPANVVNNAPMAEEPGAGDAPVYDPANQSGVAENVFWVWSPQFAGDYYGMPF
uniref:Two-component response regulator ARR1 n=1 Tax=Aegilops tauschii TaxID=37682 RepID=R7VZG1_AEGTA